MTPPVSEIHRAFVTPAVLGTTAYDPPLGRESAMRLHLNENFYGPPEECCAAGVPNDPGELATYAEGNSLLEDALAAHHGIDVNRVLVTLGAAGALQQIFAATLSRGRSVLLPKPSWSYYRTLSTTAGANLREYPLVVRDAHWMVDRSPLAAELTVGPALVIINTPHMPTGSIVAPADIAQWAQAHPRTLFVVDQAYYGYPAHDEMEPGGIADLENILLVRSFSKLYALVSQRVGYIVGSASLLREIRKLSPLFGIPLGAQRSASAALAAPHYFSANAAGTRLTRARFIATMNSTGDFLAYPSESNFVPVRCLTQPSERVANYLGRRGFRVRDCRGYGLVDHVRVTLARPAAMEKVAGLMLEAGRSVTDNFARFG